MNKYTATYKLGIIALSEPVLVHGLTPTYKKFRITKEYGFIAKTDTKALRRAKDYIKTLVKEDCISITLTGLERVINIPINQ